MEPSTKSSAKGRQVARRYRYERKKDISPRCRRPKKLQHFSGHKEGQKDDWGVTTCGRRGEEINWSRLGTNRTLSLKTKISVGTELLTTRPPGGNENIN